jgi:hypothetical protein
VRGRLSEQRIDLDGERIDLGRQHENVVNLSIDTTDETAQSAEGGRSQYPQYNFDVARQAALEHPMTITATIKILLITGS